jgi:hypothetical protein
MCCGKQDLNEPTKAYFLVIVVNSLELKACDFTIELKPWVGMPNYN